MQEKEKKETAQKNNDFSEKQDKPETGEYSSASVSDSVSDNDSKAGDLRSTPTPSKSKRKKARKSDEKSKGEQEEILVKEKNRLYDQLLRTQAEQENFKKRISKETATRIKYANKSLINELLPVLDNFERALESSLNHDDAVSLKQGVELTLRQIRDVLSKAGLTQVKAVGEQFDPSRHEAVMQLESDKHENNTVIQEHQKGYFLHDQILRPAMVTVTKNKPTDKKDNQGE